jgi:hypothetical protein
MQKTLNPIRPLSFRTLGLLTLAVVLLASSSLAQSSAPGRGTYRISSGGVGVAHGQSIHINLTSKNKWFPPCDITPGGYVATVDISLVNAEGRELARDTKRIDSCGITSMNVNVDDILRDGSRMTVRAVVKLVESGERDGAPPALGASIEVSDNATGKTTVIESFEPQPQPWVLSEQ